MPLNQRVATIAKPEPSDYMSNVADLDNAVAKEDVAGESLAVSIEVYKAVTEHFRQDLREFWVRANFYLLVQTGLLAVFVNVSPSAPSSIAFMIAGLGLTLAIVWRLVLHGSLHWIKVWRLKLVEVESRLDPYSTLSSVEQIVISRPHLSPSHITQFVPTIFIASWLLNITWVFIGSFDTEVTSTVSSV